MEIQDLYDCKRNKLNKVTRRDIDTPKQGEYKLSIHVWIMNDKGEFLIQKRKNDLKRHPGKWGFTGGGVVSGETSIDGVKRELKEELSIEVNEDKIELLFSIKRHIDFVDVWLLEDNFDISLLSLQKEEVDEVKWVSKNEILKLLENDLFVSSFNLYKDLLFKLVEDKKIGM